jgi:vitamin B12 transporter
VGVVSTSFRAPSSAELLDKFYGNPTHNAEDQGNRELGQQYDLDPGLLRIVGFRTQTSNAVVFDGKTGKYGNIAETRNSGIEADLLSSFQGWNYKFSMVIHDPRDLADNSRLLRRAKQYSSLSLNRVFAGIDWGGRVLYSGDRVDYPSRTLSSYTVVDLFASKRVSPDWVVRLKLENITNEPYQLAYGYNAPPRGTFLTLQYQPRQTAANRLSGH